MATAAAAEAGPAPKGKKKLIIIIVAALLVVLLGGGAAVVMMKKKAHAAEMEEGADEEEEAPEAHAKSDDKKHAPIFVPMDVFVVNLADKDAERYAQIGVTLELQDPKAAEDIKTYLPAIRSGVLMVLSHKTSAELLEREGKEALAREIMRESMLPLGFDLDEVPTKKRKKAPEGPVKSVLFSTFIIQ